MKDVLTLYGKPLEVARPLVCFDEKSVQLLEDSRPDRPVRAGRARRRDYEYVRRGTRNIFMFSAPKRGQRHTLVTQRRTKEDFAQAMCYLVDVLHPEAACIDVVWDQLNTHHVVTLIEIFGKAKADRILSRLCFHYTPVHASWLNMAEIELHALTGQCLNRRIGSEWMLITEMIAWEASRNQAAVPIRWTFDWKRAKRLFAKHDELSADRGRQN
jgi:DDE superfamily endonuclease